MFPWRSVAPWVKRKFFNAKRHACETSARLTCSHLAQNTTVPKSSLNSSHFLFQFNKEAWCQQWTVALLYQLDLHYLVHLEIIRRGICCTNTNCKWVYACVYLPVASIMTSSGGGHPAPLPASCHTVSPKSDRQRETHCYGPKISCSLSTHPSVCVCQCLLAGICSLSIFLYYTATFSMSVLHRLAHINKCKSLPASWNSSYVHRHSCMLCFIHRHLCIHVVHVWSAAIILNSGYCLHIFSPPCIILKVT